MRVVYTNTDNSIKTQRNCVALKTARACVKAGTSKTKANILLDEGAQRSFITFKAAERLDLLNKCSETENVSLATFGAQTTGVRSLKVTSFQIQSVTGPNINIRALITPEISTSMRKHVDDSVLNLPYLKHLQLAEPPDTEIFDIEILIGADYYWDIVGDNVVRGDGPTAVSSRLGYLLSGPLPRNVNPPRPNDSKVLLIMTNTKQEEYELQKYWDLESIGIKDDPRSTTRSEYLTYRDTHLNKEDGRYVAKLPWKSDHPPLPTNRDTAEARIRNMVRKLEPALRETYNCIIEDQLNKGFIEEVTNDDESGHYIPHHAVKKDSSTTPIRIVYDCSCKTKGHPSLNDCLEKGQPLLNDMVAMLIRFRINNIGLSSDLEKAFLNVRLHPSDRKYTKFLWLSNNDDPESDFKVYQFSSVLFGAACSPFILNAVVKTELEKLGDPLSMDLKDNIYVDNILTGVQTTGEAVDYYNFANATMASCGFKLRSWASNDETTAEIASRDNLHDQNVNIKTLGLNWNVKDDKLSFAGIKQQNNVTTKREVVRLTSSIYDPLGLLTPVQVSAKSFIQELWQKGVGWDEPLSDDLTKRWNVIFNELQEATDTIINRRYFTDSETTGDYELHTFCDASMSAYGAAIYLCHNQQTSLVMAQNRVKPLKEITLPRMELLGILLGTRLTHFVREAFKSKLNIARCTVWSDSQIAIHWTRSDKTLPCFVHNRVQEIRAFSGEIKYCPTHENPGDLLTRPGITAKVLNQSTLWWKGPSWLPQGDWPLCQLFDDNTALCTLQDELASEQTSVETTTNAKQTETGIHCVLDINTFSSLGKLLRVTAYVLRFVNKLKKTIKTKPSVSLQANEINSAELEWIKSCQTSAYKQEMKSLQRENKKHSSLQKQLRLFLDDQGILRCGSRLHNAPINYDTKFPILLPPQHQLTELIILDCHQKVLHSGLQTTVAQIRQRYWITKIRQRVKTLLRKCVVCKKINGKPYSAPINPPLPQCR